MIGEEYQCWIRDTTRQDKMKGLTMAQGKARHYNDLISSFICICIKGEYGNCIMRVYHVYRMVTGALLFFGLSFGRFFFSSFFLFVFPCLTFSVSFRQSF